VSEPLSHTEWETLQHERAEGWHDEYGPADVADDRPEFKKRMVDMPVRGEGRRGTYEELREMKIAAHECPLPGCAGTLDEDWFCSHCGFVSTPGGSKSEQRKENQNKWAA
jgi:hypothetical protein